MTRLRDAVLAAWPEIDGCGHVPQKVKDEIADALTEEPRVLLILDLDQNARGATLPPIVSGSAERGVLITSAGGPSVFLEPETAKKVARVVAPPSRRFARVGRTTG